MDPLTQVENALWFTCDHLLMHNTNPWELDEALLSAGFVTGPCEMQDHAGLVHVLARGSAHSSPVLPRMVAEGRVGKTGGVGFYRYPGGGGAVIDPLIEDLILEEAWFHKTERVALPDQDLIGVVLQALRQAVEQFTPDKSAMARRLRINEQVFAQLMQ